MGKRAPVWRDFSSQDALRQAVRAIVDAEPFESEFESELISDLIVERHYFCSIKGLRPLRFKKTAEQAPYRFYGYFECIRWHSVSWDKCVRPPPSRRDHIDRALRDRISQIKLSYRRANPICEYCHSAPAVETHHELPTWTDIMESIFSEVRERDVQDAFAAWDWFNAESFVLPEDNRMTYAFDAIHRKAVLRALCKPCHDSTKLNKPNA